MRELSEADVEQYLATRAIALGGEVRKVQWVSRKYAPDRVVMLPADGKRWPQPRTIWVELKAPGGLAKFPKNAHERGQLREHARMREVGQDVRVIDSWVGVDWMLG